MIKFNNHDAVRNAIDEMVRKRSWRHASFAADVSETTLKNFVGQADNLNLTSVDKIADAYGFTVEISFKRHESD